MAVTTGLYPPIVMDTAPAFVRTESCKIYFSLSMYNSVTDIKNVQVSLVNQKTNASALKTSLYPSGIKLTNLQYDPDKKGDYNYYIQIDPAKDLEDGIFGLNQFYKVQLRFTSISAPQLPNNQPLQDGTGLAKWLYDNMKYFSEWSKVCLIKGITQPQISIRGFDNAENGQRTVLTTPLIEIIGELTYSNQNNSQEQEYLKSYNIKLYEGDNNLNLLLQSGEIYTNPHNPNEFNYQLSYDLLDGINYTLTLTYTTNNLYTKTDNYNFTIIQYGVDRLNADVFVTKDDENGKIRIDVISKDTDKFVGNLTIRRTSSKSNFHKWEDVKTVTYITGTELNYTWYDTTVESGIWYKYCVQKRNALGDRGTIIPTNGTEPVMCLLDDIFLTKNNCQLKIKLNPSMNEFKYNVTESQQVALGAKYPYVKRNGSNYFRTFPIGGLISSFIDSTDWYDPHFYDKDDGNSGEFHNDENEIKNFTSKAKIYGETPIQELYNNYNNENGITEYNDYIYEREFRNKVYDFLYKHDVKLFRSTTEGNILIKLMNIDFQPVESLGRRLYSFTATAVEIDEANILNYDKYDIQTIGQYEKYIIYTHEVLGQISGLFGPDDENIINNKIDVKYKRSSNKGFINQVQSLKWLRLEIDTPPYVIIEQNGQLIQATTSSQIQTSNATIGYIIQINDIEMIVYPQTLRYTTNLPQKELSDQEYIDYVPTEKVTYMGIFELKEENTLITSLRFKYPVTATIDYIANLEEIEDTSGLATKKYYYYKAGQLYGTFQSQDSLIKKIYNKYLLDYNKYYQRLLDITRIRIEGPPGTVVYIQDSQDEELKRHVLANGQLELQESETMIKGLYFYGIHMFECSDPLRVNDIIKGDIQSLKNNEYIMMEGSYKSFEEIEKPIPNGVYQLPFYAINSIDYNNRTGLLTVDDDYIYTNVDENYSFILQSLFEKSNKYIYYNDEWHLFTEDHDILCPVNGLVDYYCEVMKGVY